MRGQRWYSMDHSGIRVATQPTYCADSLRMPAIEIIDSRISNWNRDLPDTIADNASSAGVVLGGQATSVDDIDLRSLTGTLIRNDEVISTGRVLLFRNPVTAVAWLATRFRNWSHSGDRSRHPFWIMYSSVRRTFARGLIVPSSTFSEESRLSSLTGATRYDKIR